MTEFRMIDTKRPDGCYVEFARRLTRDADFDASDFEPSLRSETRRKLRSGEWDAFGVQAEAHITVVSHGVGQHHTMTSPGLWGCVVAGRNDPHLDDVYAEELDGLRDTMKALGMTALIEVGA